MSEIEFFTSDELIAELMSRKTFVGFLVRAEEEVVNELMPQDWKLHSRNLTPVEVVSILSLIVQWLEDDLEKGGPQWKQDEA